MCAAALAPSGPTCGDLGSDQGQGPWGNGGNDGVKDLEQVSPLLLAEGADPLRVLPNRLADNIALRSTQPGSRLSEPIHCSHFAVAGFLRIPQNVPIGR